MKKRTKKLLSMLLVGVMTVSLAACGQKGGEEKEGGDSEGGSGGLSFTAEEAKTLEDWGAAVKKNLDGTEITVAMASHPSTDAFKKMEKEFTDLTGIKVVWDIVEETNLKNKQLLDAQGAGSYDVFMVDAFWMSEYASKKVLVPISDYAEDETKTPEWFDYEDIMPAYRNGIAGAGGVNYGIPTAGETRFIA